MSEQLAWCMHCGLVQVAELYRCRNAGRRGFDECTAAGPWGTALIELDPCAVCRPVIVGLAAYRRRIGPDVALRLCQALSRRSRCPVRRAA